MPSSEIYPGICDFHVHVGERIGGYQLRDGFADIDLIARKRGIAAIGAFVTEEAGMPLTTKLRRLQYLAEKSFSGQVLWHLTPVKADIEEVFPLLQEGCDLKFYTTYKNAGLYTSYERIERWMQDLSNIKTRILVHCEDDVIICDHSGKRAFTTPFVHTLRRPESAEIKAAERVLELAVKHAYPVHIVHVSSPTAALLIREAKTNNPHITCETAPHYLLYNEDILKGENAHRWLCSPPFRSEHSRGLLVELLQDGCFDIIASDHCPFSAEDKDRYKDTPEKVPCGIPGLETLFTSLYSALVQKGILSLEQLLGICCVKPADLMGIRNELSYSLENLSSGV